MALADAAAGPVGAAAELVDAAVGLAGMEVEEGDCAPGPAILVPGVGVGTSAGSAVAAVVGSLEEVDASALVVTPVSRHLPLVF